MARTFAVLLILLVFGGLAYIAFSDVIVEQVNITKEIPQDQYLEE